MKCTDVRAALPLLIYGEPSAEEAALREHLANCPACRREAEAFEGVRRLLDDAPAPRVEVDVAQLHRSLAERQMWRARGWRRLAVALGAIAALLLFTIGLRVEVHLQEGQLVMRWGEPPPPVPAPPSPQPFVNTAALPSETEAQLRVLSDLIHALKQDADERDQHFTERLDRLQKHVLALQEQANLRWNATEQDVAALYLLTRKGEKP